MYLPYAGEFWVGRLRCGGGFVVPIQQLFEFLEGLLVFSECLSEAAISARLATITFAELVDVCPAQVISTSYPERFPDSPGMSLMISISPTLVRKLAMLD